MSSPNDGTEDAAATPIVRSRLNRDRIVSLLGEMVTSLSGRQQGARIRIVGGSAIALVYSGGRDVTGDVDAISDPEEVVLSAAAEARRRHPDLSDDWFNGAAGQYLPNGFGRAQEWVQIYSRDKVTIEVPSPEMLLAIKIDAAQRRGRRDGIDLPHLLAAAGVSNTGDAERIYEDFYPGDDLTERTYLILDAAVRHAMALDTHLLKPEQVGAEIQEAIGDLPESSGLTHP